MNRRLTTSLAVSVAAHLVAAGATAWWLRERRPPPDAAAYGMPVELIAPDLPEAPPTPEPTTPSDPAPAPEAAREPAPAEPPPAVTPPPKPKAAKPARPKPSRPADGSAAASASASAPTAATASPTPPDGSESAGGSDGEADAPARTLARARDAVDLAPYVPGGARLRLVVRLDRLRGTPWLTSLDTILQPMPDYRTVIEGSGLGIGEAFDVLVIATPDARDVTATFLAARLNVGEAQVQEAFTGPKERPRVVWEPVAGGTVGKRDKDPRVHPKDPRVFLMPYPGWILLTRPEHVKALLAPPETAASAPGAPPAASPGGDVGDMGDAGDAGLTSAPPPPPPPSRPAWLERLGDLAAEPADVSDPAAAEASARLPVAVVGLSGLGVRAIELPGLTPVPAPPRTSVAIDVNPQGFSLTGRFDFASEKAAREFVTRAEAARREALDSVGTRLLLSSVQALGAVRQLSFAQVGAVVVFSTSVTQDEARVLMDAAASWAREFFTP